MKRPVSELEAESHLRARSWSVANPQAQQSGSGPQQFGYPGGGHPSSRSLQRRKRAPSKTPATAWIAADTATPLSGDNGPRSQQARGGEPGCQSRLSDGTQNGRQVTGT